MHKIWKHKMGKKFSFTNFRCTVKKHNFSGQFNIFIKSFELIPKWKSWRPKPIVNRNKRWTNISFTFCKQLYLMTFFIFIYGVEICLKPDIIKFCNLIQNKFFNNSWGHISTFCKLKRSFKCHESFLGVSLNKLHIDFRIRRLYFLKKVYCCIWVCIVYVVLVRKHINKDFHSNWSAEYFFSPRCSIIR